MATNFVKSIRSSIKHWYIPLLIGILFLVIGIYTLRAPLASYVALSVLFSISFLLAGLFEIVFSISNRDELDNWGWTLTFGIITLLIGLLLVARPELSMATLPFYVGFLVMFRSISAIGFAIDLRHYHVEDWAILLVFGIIGLLFSFILLWNPLFAGLTVVIWTALALLASGVFSIYLAMKLKKLKKKVSKYDEMLDR